MWNRIHFETAITTFALLLSNIINDLSFFPHLRKLYPTLTFFQHVITWQTSHSIPIITHRERQSANLAPHFPQAICLPASCSQHALLLSHHAPLPPISPDPVILSLQSDLLDVHGFLNRFGNTISHLKTVTKKPK